MGDNALMRGLRPAAVPAARVARAVRTAVPTRALASAPGPHMPVERIAFGDRPDAPVAVGLGDPPGQRWLAAVVLGARGRYAAAAELLEGVCRERRASTAVRAHAAVTRAAHLRQLGGHAEARRWDGIGLALATRTPGDRTQPASAAHRSDAVCAVSEVRAVGGEHEVAASLGLDLAAARADALIGLAADAIGLADPTLAEGLLRRAERAVREHPSWRPTVRWYWVRAELALSTGRPGQARSAARRAVEAAKAVGAVRHELKSALVHSVADASAGRPTDELAVELTALAERARRVRLSTLEWPARLVLADLIGGVDLARSGGCRRRAVHVLACIRRRADPQGRRILDSSPWVPDISESLLLHSDACHPPETCRSAHSSRMECKNRP
ncbi:MAG: hypothetical protein J2P20_04065 [Pseudonocardia sp.]|nr:hypothetical protein [Pseudonocardia sp.]